ncbi:MAG: BatA and WFA domain-containing protein [Planctomycetes bacterium]|nr:BatA and WFA domain-containing protein [Planctomycetota bacterium]
MQWMNPGAAIWSLVFIAPVVLYLFRRKRRTIPVSTLNFFKMLAREHQETAWLRKLKRLLSFLLSVLVLAAALGALLQPVVSPSTGAVRSVVILLDRSASMSAVSPGGRTLFDEAVLRVRHKLAGLPSGVGVMLMTYDSRTEILQPRTYDRRQVERALQAISPRPVEGDPGAALLLADKLASLDAPAVIWHVTDDPPGRLPDFGPDQEAPAARRAAVEHVQVALDSPVNAGIVSFQIRKLPLERSRYEAFIQVACSAPEQRDVELEVRLDGALTAIRSLPVAPGERQSVLLPVSAAAADLLELAVRADGDVLPLDDRIVLRVPEVKPIKVVLASEAVDPFMELALCSLGGANDMDVYYAKPSDWPPRLSFDVAIFESWLPDSWPGDMSVILVNPPRSLGPVNVVPVETGGLPVDSIRSADESHPLLYGVATARAAVTQTAVLEADGALEPLWVGPMGPLLSAGEIHGQKVTVMAFSPKVSERLPLTASFPLMIGNALYWSVQSGDDAARRSCRKTGSLVETGGSSVTWTLPGGQPSRPAALKGRWLELDRLGLWRTDTGEHGAAALLSLRETLLPSLPPASETRADVSAETALVRGDLAPLLLLALVAVLVLESWLFHRHSVY